MRYATLEAMEAGREVCAEETCSELATRYGSTGYCWAHLNHHPEYHGRRPFIAKPDTRTPEQRERDACAEILRALRAWRVLSSWQVEAIARRHVASGNVSIRRVFRWATVRREESAPLHGKNQSGQFVDRLRMRRGRRRT